MLLPLSHVQDELFLLRTGERLGLECHVFVLQPLCHPEGSCTSREGKGLNPAFGKGHTGLPSKIGLICGAQMLFEVEGFS